MKQRENLFLRRPRRRGLPLGGKALLVIALIISSLSACAGQVAHQGATPSSTRQPDPTPSSTQLLQQEGPASGLYIGDVGNDAAGNDDALYRVDYQSGKVFWKYQFRLSKPIPGVGKYAPPFGLIVQQGLVFVESFEVVYAVTAATGHLAWSYTFDSPVELVRGQISIPVLSQGIYYFTGTKEKEQNGDLLYALDARTGKLLRTYPSVRGFAIQDNVVYTSDLDSGPIRAMNLKTGQVLWQKSIAGPEQHSFQFFMAPFLLKHTVYFRTNNQLSTTYEYESSLYAFDAMNGQQLWHSPSVTVSGPVADFPISDQTIVSGVIGDGLSAYDAANGDQLWSRKMGFAGNLMVEGKSIYATFDPNGMDFQGDFPPQDPHVPGIMSLDGGTGSLIWQKLITTQLAGDPSSDTILGFLVHKSILYINQNTPIKGHETYRTTAMDAGGKVLWQINLGGYAAEVLVS
ncbi:MAG: PQQ-binding-like beta-propeller repeat protein [Ktedonobacteraceae bacterium]